MTALPRRWLFVLTILVGSFLLFQVQPMVARMVLPKLGGAPAVWNSAMLVYQALLLGGYAYAHWLGRFTVQRQAMIHVALFLVAALWAAPRTSGLSWRVCARARHTADAPGGGLRQSLHQLQQGGLAGPVGPEDDRAPRQRQHQRKRVEHSDLAAAQGDRIELGESLRQQRLWNGMHEGRSLSRAGVPHRPERHGRPG